MSSFVVASESSLSRRTAAFARKSSPLVSRGLSLFLSPPLSLSLLCLPGVVRSPTSGGPVGNCKTMNWEKTNEEKQREGRDDACVCKSSDPSFFSLLQVKM